LPKRRERLDPLRWPGAPANGARIGILRGPLLSAAAGHFVLRFALAHATF
jgi:hypothetical protein